MAKAKKPRQRHLPEMEPDSIPEIDKATEAYVEVRDERMELTQEEVKRHDALLALMDKHKLEYYEYDGRIVRVKKDQTTKVKVEKKKEPKDEEDTDEE